MQEQQSISVSSMVKQTGENTHKFLNEVSNHIELLENEIIKLKDYIKQLEEAKNND